MPTITVTVTQSHLDQAHVWYNDQAINSGKTLISSTHNPLSLALHEADASAFAFFNQTSIEIVRGDSHWLKWSQLPAECRELFDAFNRREYLLRFPMEGEADDVVLPALPIRFTVKIPEYAPPVKQGTLINVPEVARENGDKPKRMRKKANAE